MREQGGAYRPMSGAPQLQPALQRGSMLHGRRGQVVGPEGPQQVVSWTDGVHNGGAKIEGPGGLVEQEVAE